MSNSVLGIVIVNCGGHENRHSTTKIESCKHVLNESIKKISSEFQADNQTMEWIEVVDSSSSKNGCDVESMKVVKEIVASGSVKFVLRKTLSRSLRDSALNINFVRILSKYGCQLIEF